MEATSTSQRWLSPEELAELRKPKRALQHVYYAAFILLSLVGAALAVRNDALRWAGTVVLAFSYNAFFIIVHECSHGLASNRKAVNRALGFVFCIPLLMSFTAYTRLHHLHHQNLGEAGDPDEYKNYSTNPMVLWLMHFMRLTMASFLYIAAIPTKTLRLGEASSTRKMVTEYIALAVIWAILVWQVPGHLILVLWWYPAILANFLINIRGLTQHTLTDPSDPLLASRSIRSPAWVGVLYLFENYHLEHHLYPAVPCYRLPELSRVLSQRWSHSLQVPGFAWFVGQFLVAAARRDEAVLGHIVGPGGAPPRG